MVLLSCRTGSVGERESAPNLPVRARRSENSAPSNACAAEPVTSRAVLTGRGASREPGNRPSRGLRHLRIGGLLLGSAATVLLAIVGCTTVTGGSGTVDTAVAPAYRASVSASVSASSATSRIRETQRQQSLTTRAVRTSCEAFASTSKDAIEKVNAFVAAYNAGGNTGPQEGPAIDALNHSADAVTGSLSDALSAGLRDALNAYVDAARGVANAIATHAATSEFNRRVDQLNDTKSKAVQQCIAAS